ncbi:MAG: class I SAM-dependent methyltransferase [Patescibacteria group bacterium]|nr:class I SAM-dependent methyltransferase [Patescibacteria group bacterium]
MNKQSEEKILNIVKKNYDDIAEQYNETRKKHLEPLWNHLVEYAKEAPKRAKILDIGCGNGRLIEAFNDMPIDYLGIDPCEELINKAKEQKYGFRFELGNILELDKFEETNFDYIFSTAVIHHLPGQALRIKALKQMKNKLNENGKIILTVWNLWSQKRFQRLLLKFNLKKLIFQNKMDFNDILFPWKNPQGKIVSERYYHAFTKKKLKKISQKADLKIEKLFKDKFNYYLVLTK